MSPGFSRCSSLDRHAEATESARGGGPPADRRPIAHGEPHGLALFDDGALRRRRPESSSGRASVLERMSRRSTRPTRRWSRTRCGSTTRKGDIATLDSRWCARALAAAPTNRGFRDRPGGTAAPSSGEPAEGEALLREATRDDNPNLAAGAWLDLAQFRHAMRDFAAAADAKEKALELADPPGPQLLFEYADSLILADRFDEALRVAEDIPVAAQSALIRARVAQERGEHVRALAAFGEALRLWPDIPWARYYAAVSAEKLGDFDRALEEYRYSIRINPAATDARTRAAQILVAERHLPQAYQLAFLQIAEAPLELEGQLLSLYLVSRISTPADLQQALEKHRAQHPASFPEALARAAEGAAERAGDGAAVRLLGSAPGIDYGAVESAPVLRAPGPLRPRRRAARARPPCRRARALGPARSRGVPRTPRPRTRAERRAARGNDRRVWPGARARSAECRRPVGPVSPGYRRRSGGSHVRVRPGGRGQRRGLCARAHGGPGTSSPGQAQLAAERLSALLQEHPFDVMAANERVSLDLERESVTPSTLDAARRVARFGGGAEAFEQLGGILNRWNIPRRLPAPLSRPACCVRLARPRARSLTQDGALGSRDAASGLAAASLAKGRLRRRLSRLLTGHPPGGWREHPRVFHSRSANSFDLPTVSVFRWLQSHWNMGGFLRDSV